MFIPAQFVREAFAILTPIFERQTRRAQYVEENRESSKNLEVITRHFTLVNVPYDFITLVQATLMSAIGCPIIVVSPSQ
jgi:hypothetical protein